MNKRFGAVVGGAVVLLGVTSGVRAQDPPAVASGAAIGISGLLDPAEGAPLPVTPWGDPDLRGVWNNSNRTPLEPDLA